MIYLKYLFLILETFFIYGSSYFFVLKSIWHSILKIMQCYSSLTFIKQGLNCYLFSVRKDMNPIVHWAQHCLKHLRVDMDMDRLKKCVL